MGNLIGEGFSKYVINQITQREKIHGSVYRNNEQLAYLNANSSYIKLMSSVNIKSTDRFLDSNLKNEISKAGLDNGLAKKLILFGGVYNTDSKQNYGIVTDGSILNHGAYGFGGNEFGISPMPGIESANVESLNRGSLRKASVTITAYNRTQFEMIETLYLRLGLLFY